MEYTAYVIWLIMGVFGIVLALINAISKKTKGQENALAKKLFSSGIYFTVFMLVATVVIYQRTGPSIAFMFSAVFFMAGVSMMMGRVRRDKEK